MSTANGAVSMLPPATLRSAAEADAAPAVVSEVKAYGDVALRFVSGAFAGPFLPGFEAIHEPAAHSYGLQRLDHCVGNAPELFDVTDYLMKVTGAQRLCRFEHAGWDSHSELDLHVCTPQS